MGISNGCDFLKDIGSHRLFKAGLIFEESLNLSKSVPHMGFGILEDLGEGSKM